MRGRPGSPPPVACIALLACALLASLAPAPAAAKPTVVSDVEGLRAALAAARPGARIELAPGTYAGGLVLRGIQGKAGKPVVLAARDPEKPPVFRAGTSGLQLSEVAHLVLEDLVFEGARGNGLNLDDGGTPESPSRHVTLRRLVVRDVGPDGNRDGIKCSGVDDLRIEECRVERWGRGGSAVDLVGCHRVLIEGCTFRHSAGMRAGSGVQAKGGSADVTIRRCRFEHAGSRAVNAGGSTGLAYFRPALAATKPPFAEARDVRVLGCTIVGSAAAVAFVGVDGAEVRCNTIHRPGRWAFRILQETRDERFVPCRRGLVAKNLVVFRSDAWASGGVNVGAGTEPASFRFEGNAWTCEDAPARTRALVRLPVAEKDGAYGEDPRFPDADGGDLRIGRRSRLRGVGAEAWKP